MIIAVGSTNPTKINPVREVFAIHFADSEVHGISVESGVTEQPMSEDEMYKGALNRAMKSIDRIQGAVFGVGIEGGLHKCSFGWFEKSLVVIIDKDKRIGVGASGGLILPESVISQIQSGSTLEQAIDTLAGTTKIGQGIGMFGVMTNSVVTRSSGVKHGVAFALARFLHPEFYDV